MHEMGLVRDLLSRAEAAADGGTIKCLRIRVGALAGADPAYLLEYLDREATERWGSCPAIEIELSEDATNAEALGVVLVSLEV